jgi:vitamin B12 transporter
LRIERHTSDLRGELSGTVDHFGYYITGGNINSKGLVPGNRVNFNHAFGKLTYDLPSRGKLTFGLDFRDISRGLEDYAPFDYHDTGSFRNASSYLSFSQPLADRLTLDLNGYWGRRQLTSQWGALSVPDLFKDTTSREDSQGANVRLYWGGSDANLTAGLEYEHNNIKLSDPVIQVPELNFDSRLDCLSAYLNGSYTIGPLTVLPGIRYDHYNLLEDALSYTLGATLQMTDTTVFRIYGARGYSLPVINNLAIINGRRELQNINTIQAGIETTAIPYLWLKGTLFYNNIWKIQEFDTSNVPATITLREQIKQGFELEAKTSPFYGLAVTGGYTYIHAWDKQSKAQLTGFDGAPLNGTKLGLNYNNNSIGLRGALTGNYVWWRIPADNNPRYKSMIWDLHLTQKLFSSKELSPEIFFSARNLFNGYQYQDQIRPNTPRWFEGGVRFKF